MSNHFFLSNYFLIIGLLAKDLIFNTMQPFWISVSL